MAKSMGGELAPAFVEWTMGFPKDFTLPESTQLDSAHSATPSRRRSRKRLAT